MLLIILINNFCMEEKIDDSQEIFSDRKSFPTVYSTAMESDADSEPVKRLRWNILREWLTAKDPITMSTMSRLFLTLRKCSRGYLGSYQTCIIEHFEKTVPPLMFDILRKQSTLQYAPGRYDTKDFISRSNKNEYVERINETNEYEINPHYSYGKPASIYFSKVNNRNTRKRCDILFKLTIKTPKRRY